jgi:predicted PurR-regulated permease PerM
MALTTNTIVWKFMIAIFLILTSFVIVLFYFKQIFIALVIGALLIIFTNILRSDFKRKMKKRKYSKLKRKLYSYGQLLFWVFTFYILVVTQISDIGILLKSTQERKDSGLETILKNEYVPQFFKDRIQNFNQLESIENYFFTLLSNGLSGLSVFFFNAVLIIPLMFYLYFKKKEKIMKFVFDSVPKKYHKGFIKATKDIGAQLYDFFSAKIVESIVVGSICALGFYIIGIKGWLFLSIIAGFFNVIPYIGPMIGGLLAVFVGYIESPYIAFFALITVIIAQLVDNLYLIPFMISFKLKIDPLVNILIILISAKLFGIFGMVFAIPIFIVYKIVLSEAYTELAKIYPEK